MRYDSSTRPPRLAALLEQIAVTEARIAQLDRELAAIGAGRLLTLDPPRRSASDGSEALDVDAENARPRLRVIAASPAAEERGALIARPTPQRGVRPLRQPGRPAKKHHHSHPHRH